MVANDLELLLRSTVLPVLFRRGQAVEPIGTCFVVAIAGNEAIALSARHLFDHAIRDEWTIDTFTANLPPDLQPEPPSSISLGSTQLHSAYISPDGAPHLLNIEMLNTSSVTDLAVCRLSFAAPNTNVHFEKRLAIRPAPVATGQPATIVGYSNYAGYAATPYPTEGVKITFSRSIRLVTGKSSKEAEIPLLSRGPLFSVDQSSVHGMSGGPIFSGKSGERQFVIGVVSQGASDSPTTVGAELWPIYGFKIPWLETEGRKSGSLLEMAELGHLEDDSDPIKHFRSISLGGRQTMVDWEP